MGQKDFDRQDMEATATYQARQQHQTLIQKLMSGPGDSEGAMRRAEASFGLSYWAQWRLRYRRKATGQFIAQISQAYTAMLRKSVKRDLEQLKIDQAKGDTDDDLQSLIAEAETLLARIEARKG